MIEVSNRIPKRFSITDIATTWIKTKNNTVIMLTRNINIQKGLCNGTKYEMTNLKPHVIEAKILT